MNKNEIIETLKGQSFVVSTAEVKQNDINVYDALLESIREFAADESNMTDDSDVEAFENGEWKVQYLFTEDEVLISFSSIQPRLSFSFQ